jgi:ATP-dependent RNA helicase DHX8/PRP22
MSATIDKNKFSTYYDNCPVIEVPGQAFPVKIHYSPNEKDYVKQSVNKLKDLLKTEDSIDGDVLVFLPTVEDINNAIRLFNKEFSKKENFLVLPLHGKLEPEEQAKIFEETKNKQKIIFSTNIAETSVTIKGVRIVVDSGRAKERTYDQNRNISVFKIKQITQSSAIQRKGRAGRCSAGVCYRLYSSQDYQDMEPILEPEIFRMHLGIVILQLLSCGIEDLFDYDLIDKPTHEALLNSMQKLESLRMIKENKITDYGLIASELYLEPSISRIIIEGLELGVGNEMLKIAAMMTITYCLYGRALTNEEKKKKRLTSSQEEGDFVSLLTIYNEFASKKYKEQREWCTANDYSLSSLLSAKKAFKELYSALLGIKESPLASSIKTTNTPSSSLILKCICAGLHANLAYYDGRINAESVYKLLDLNQQAFISNDSVLHVLADEDYDNRFLLFSDLYRTERTYMRNLTPVRIEMLSEYTSRDLSSIESRAKVAIRVELSDKIAHNLKNKSEEYVERLEEELGYAVLIRDGFLEAFVPAQVEQQAKRLINKCIENVKQKSSSELHEFIPEGETVNYKVLFRAGLNVQSILFSNEYIRINIYDLPGATDHSHIENEFSKFGPVVEFKLNKSASNKINGHVLFSNCESAQRAYAELNNKVYLDAHLNLRPCNSVDGSLVLRNTRVKASWFISEPSDVAYVKFAAGSSLDLIRNRLATLGFKASIDSQAENKIRISNALSRDRNMDEKVLKELASAFAQVEDCYMVRKEMKEDDMLKNSYAEGIKIKAFFERYGRFNEIDIIPYGVAKSGKLIPKITVNIYFTLIYIY